jgi:hypothetical protein
MTDQLAAPPQPGTPDYPSVFPDLPGRTATEDEFREHFGELEPDGSILTRPIAVARRRGLRVARLD